MAEELAQGRDAFAQRAWAEAYRRLAAYPRDLLEGPDRERLAVAAYLSGHDDACAAAWEAAHRSHLEKGDIADAARCSFWLALSLLLGGHSAHAGGWLSRTASLISDVDCSAAGYLLIPGLLGALDDGDAAAARDMAMQATGVGRRFGDPDLCAFGTLGHGQALIALGDAHAGTEKLDEVMVSVTAGEVGPITSGIVYCAVVLEYMHLFDLPRATEWTRALSTWCDSQPGLVPYRGQCMVHRSQLQQAAGEWPDAVLTVVSACEHLTDPPHPALGLAYYQAAELHRLLGAFEEARAEYRLANRSGYQPMPGLALLEQTCGDVRSAAATIRRALTEVEDPVARPALLAAAVDIYRATGDLADARIAAEELDQVAARSSAVMLKAMAAQATGSVLLDEGEPAAALTHLTAAAGHWQHLRMPYDRARAGVLLGVSCAAIGDRSSAALEFDAAQETFAALSARPDLDRLGPLIAASGIAGEARRVDVGDPALSAREREVLAHVAAGRTNREIATELMISQHTVGRHLENIFTKLGVANRAAATAYAYEHELL